MLRWSPCANGEVLECIGAASLVARGRRVFISCIRMGAAGVLNPEIRLHATYTPCISCTEPEMTPDGFRVFRPDGLGMENTNSTEIVADEALLARIAQGDTEAFGLFYDRHCSILYGVACKILQHEVDAQDALQEACVLLWQRAAQYTPGLGRPLSWAVTLVRNKAIDRLRSESRRGAAVNRAAEEGDELSILPADFGLVDANDSDSNRMVRDALKMLPIEQQEALSLAFFGGLTHLELASRLGAPLGTIKARIRRGLLALRDALEGRL